MDQKGRNAKTNLGTDGTKLGLRTITKQNRRPKPLFWGPGGGFTRTSRQMGGGGGTTSDDRVATKIRRKMRRRRQGVETRKKRG